MDYDSLLTTVASRMNRSDLTDLIPDFIVSVESSINTFLANNPVRPMVQTYPLSATTQRVDLPDGFIDVIDLYASDGTDTWPLARVSTNSNFDYYATRALAPGISYDSTLPQQYKILGTTIVLAATPATTLTLTLDCTTKLTAVTSTNSTNWLMQSHPDVYEFGTLAHAAKHVRDMDYYNVNRDLFISALGAVPAAYPERSRPIGLRIVDGPWRSVNSG